MILLFEPLNLKKYSSRLIIQSVREKKNDPVLAAIAKARSQIRIMTHFFHFPVPVERWKAHPGIRRKMAVVLSVLNKENSP